LNYGGRANSGHVYVAFKEALAVLGWKEGQQYALDERWADNRVDALPSLAAELAAARPDLIIAWPGQAVVAAVKAAPAVPIVMALGGDPVKGGYAMSLARPGGMVTGLTNFSTDLAEKYLELLLEATPRIRNIAFLLNPSGLFRNSYMEGVQRSLSRYAVEAQVVDAASLAEIETKLTQAAKSGSMALIVAVSPLFMGLRRQIVEIATTHKWPMLAFAREFVEAGALLSYGPSYTESYRQAAVYADKILKGAKAGELPIEQPTRLEFVVNRKTAKALGIALPQATLLRASEVID
jgi:putative ABC transport system substrate-binding protein